MRRSDLHRLIKEEYAALIEEGKKKKEPNLGPPNLNRAPKGSNWPPNKKDRKLSEILKRL